MFHQPSHKFLPHILVMIHPSYYCFKYLAENMRERKVMSYIPRYLNKIQGDYILYNTHAKTPKFYPWLKFFKSWLCCCFSVTQLCPTLREPMDCSTPFAISPSVSCRGQSRGSSVWNLLNFAQTHVHWVGDAIQPSHSLSSSSSPAFNLSQHQCLF